MELFAGPDDAGRRLDRILRKALPDYSLSLIHRLLRQGNVMVDGKPAGPGARIQSGSVIQVVIHKNPAIPTPPSPTPHSPPSHPLPEIIWRGAGIIVFNKPPGLAAHGNSSLDTLVNAWLAGTLPASLSFKPGPLHRLDKPTSGAIAFSQTIEGARLFSRLLRERQWTKTYLAIVEGSVSGEHLWRDTLARNTALRKTFADNGTGAKDAVTAVKPLVSGNSHTLIEACIVTGRTHQIRAQAAAHGHPLAGDVKYGGKTATGHAGGFFLHAWKMQLAGPARFGPLANFPQPLIAPLPEAFLSRIHTLFPDFRLH